MTDDYVGLYPGFRAAALADPDAVAVVDYTMAATTYAGLLDAVDRATQSLDERTGPGDVLGLAVDHPVAFLALYLAAARLGRMTVLLESALPAAQLSRLSERFDLTVLALDDPQSDEPAGFALHEADNADEHRARAAGGYLPGDFVVHCTSGSTGEPKGIVMSQQAIDARVRLWAGDLELTSRDVVLCPLPLSHCHGIDVLTLPTLLRGATVVFARAGRLTGRGLARRIAQSGVTVVSGLPITYQLLTAASGVSETELDTLRLTISGSAPLPVSTQRLFQDRFHKPLRQVYGLSEIGVICYDRGYVGGGSVGLPVCGVEWRLEPRSARDTDGAPLFELYVRGPALARGYYRDPQAEAEMFEDGWLRTRDLLRAEPGGWYVRGRMSGFINVAGNKVGPLEVESVLCECPGVREAVVLGVPDEAGTERIAALIVADGALDLTEVRLTLGDRLRSYQLPQRYEIVPAIPRTALGKADYAAARRLLDAAAAAR
jgi:acyl-CoA synthetase (AMP-forming)/AMP-acid ligase II